MLLLHCYCCCCCYYYYYNNYYYYYYYYYYYHHYYCYDLTSRFPDPSGKKFSMASSPHNSLALISCARAASSSLAK